MEYVRRTDHAIECRFTGKLVLRNKISANTVHYFFQTSDLKFKNSTPIAVEVGTIRNCGLMQGKFLKLKKSFFFFLRQH